MSRCPSDLDLEAVVAGTRSEPHVFGCPRCAGRLADMRRLSEEFEQEVFPATVEALVARASSRRGAARPLLFFVPAALAAGLALLVLRVAGPPQEYLGLKGSALEFSAFAPAPGGARALSDGAEVPAGTGLRFEVRPSRSCKLWIVSTDSAGQVSRIFPPGGADGAKVAAGAKVAVPGGALLDGRPGPERFFAVCGCGDDPLGFDRVERAARAVGPGEAGVRATRELSGLPGDALQASLLLEKRR